jgi:two-component system cell cycle sensor histidine kinase/response regulator CckA
MLQRAGSSVPAAANGRETWDVYSKERKKISLVILDLIIPEMDGHQCLNKIFRIDPQARVIVSSGYSANCSQEKMSESGVKGFVGKPYDIGRTSLFHNMIGSL